MFHFFVINIQCLKEGRYHITLHHATMLPLGLGSSKARLLESSIILLSTHVVVQYSVIAIIFLNKELRR